MNKRADFAVILNKGCIKIMNDEVEVNDKERLKALIQLQEGRDYVSRPHEWTPVSRGTIEIDSKSSKKRSKIKGKTSEVKRGKGKKPVNSQKSQDQPVPIFPYTRIYETSVEQPRNTKPDTKVNTEAPTQSTARSGRGSTSLNRRQLKSKIASEHSIFSSNTSDALELEQQKDLQKLAAWQAASEQTIKDIENKITETRFDP